MTNDELSIRASHGHRPIRVLTLNCWGLKYLSRYRSERLSEIGLYLAAVDPPLDIVGLQECWTYHDYLSIRQKTSHILKYAKFYHSGIFGGGLVILSRWSIVESSMFRYPLNGRPTAFFRGDWFVGKGVACAKVKHPDGDIIELFNTHLHAPYEREPNDSYICHRTAQAWEIAKLMSAASDRGSLVIAMGDFNMVPMSFAHALIESRGGGVRDVWRISKPDSSIGASGDLPEVARRKKLNLPEAPNLKESLQEHGHTCDSIANTWRWSKSAQKALDRGADTEISPDDPDSMAKRLDYIFFNGLGRGWAVQDTRVVLTERHSTLRCSLSDHFGVQATLVKSSTGPEASAPIDINAPLLHRPANHVNSEIASMSERDLDKVTSKIPTQSNLTVSFYVEILDMIRKYNERELKQRRWRLRHFLGSVVISIGCMIATWWSPNNYTSFILTLISSLGLMAGTVDGLIGGLFVGSELRALAEFEWEVRNASEAIGGPVLEEKSLKDWYG